MNLFANTRIKSTPFKIKCGRKGKKREKEKRRREEGKTEGESIQKE